MCASIRSIFCLSFLFSSYSSAARAAFGSRLIVATFSIFLARSAKRSADSVSSALMVAGDALHSITVTEFPPSESCNSRVSFESL